MTDYSVLSVIQTIVTAGQHVLQGVATGTARGTISDDGGLERVVSFHEVVVPGMGANLFSCLLYTSPSPRDGLLSRMPSSA